MSHYLVDKVFEDAEKFLFIAVAVHPARNLTVPCKSMTTSIHVVLLGVVDHLVAITITESSLATFGSIELHLVFSDDCIELCFVNFFVIGWQSAAKPLRIEDCANVAATFFGQAT